MLFDTADLQLALTRSRQQAGVAGGLRRATSAPHSMDVLGQEPQASYLKPSGGPMRRVSSSLGMRRSSSFFWTPTAHGEFERALIALSTRGADITAAAIMSEMGSRPELMELKWADVDKHLKKKMMVQSRVLQQLSERPHLSTAAGDAPAASSTAGLAAGITPPSTHGLRSHGRPTTSPRMQMSLSSQMDVRRIAHLHACLSSPMHHMRTWVTG